MNTVINPAVPYWGNMPWNANPGKTINIKGMFPRTMDMSSYGQINLCEGTKDVIAMHISIRFNHREVVRNSLEGGGRWGTEEKGGPFPFELGSEFWIQIVVQQDAYLISVNGQPCWTFRHRMPYIYVNAVYIDGPFHIYQVEYADQNVAFQQPGECRPATQFPPPGMRPGTCQPAVSLPVTSPAMPYWGNMPWNLSPGKAISIKGIFPPTVDKSIYGQINFCEGNKDIIAMHISIRLNHREVVRNSLKNGQWGSEEKGGPFPFEPGSEFWIQIVVQQDAYHISVNGQQCWTFTHRMPYMHVNVVNIDGPFQIYQVEYADQNAMFQQPGECRPRARFPPPGVKPGTCHPPVSYPVTSPYHPGGSQPVTAFLEPVSNPPVPFNQIIPGGIHPGMMIYISGTPSPNFQKFTVNLQCGSVPLPPPDIAFHLDVRAYSSSAVRNIRRDNQWGQEESTAPNFPFQPSVPFDMMILIQSDKYMVAINGQHFIEFRHRLTQFSQINTLRIENDISITSVRFGR